MVTSSSPVVFCNVLFHVAFHVAFCGEVFCCGGCARYARHTKGGSVHADGAVLRCCGAAVLVPVPVPVPVRGFGVLGPNECVAGSGRRGAPARRH